MIAMKNTHEKPARGRPRAFDREQALHKALTLFWTHGYEGTSIADLVAAMAIAPPSLYAAFGSKEALYLEAVELYLRGPGGFVARALDSEPDARAFIRRVLSEAAVEFTSSSHPPGCVITSGLVASAAPHQKVADSLAQLRAATLAAIAQRLERGKAEGVLASAADSRQLAHFYGALIQGMAIQARDGASTATLMAIAELALAYWPQPEPA